VYVVVSLSYPRTSPPPPLFAPSRGVRYSCQLAKSSKPSPETPKHALASLALFTDSLPVHARGCESHGIGRTLAIACRRMAESLSDALVV
jgi:hypothetical protein